MNIKGICSDFFCEKLVKIIYQNDESHKCQFIQFEDFKKAIDLIDPKLVNKAKAQIDEKVSQMINNYSNSLSEYATQIKMDVENKYKTIEGIYLLYDAIQKNNEVKIEEYQDYLNILKTPRWCHLVVPEQINAIVNQLNYLNQGINYYNPQSIQPTTKSELKQENYQNNVGADLREFSTQTEQFIEIQEIRQQSPDTNFEKIQKKQKIQQYVQEDISNQLDSDSTPSFGDLSNTHLSQSVCSTVRSIQASNLNPELSLIGTTILELDQRNVYVDFLTQMGNLEILQLIRVPLKIQINDLIQIPKAKCLEYFVNMKHSENQQKLIGIIKLNEFEIDENIESFKILQKEILKDKQFCRLLKGQWCQDVNIMFCDFQSIYRVKELRGFLPTLKFKQQKSKKINKAQFSDICFICYLRSYKNNFTE